MSEKSKGSHPKRTRKDSGTPFLTPRTFTRSVTKLLSQPADPEPNPVVVNSEKPTSSKRKRTPSVAVSHQPSRSGTPFLAPRTFTRSVRKLLGTAVDDDPELGALNPERSTVPKTRERSKSIEWLPSTESSEANQREAVSSNALVAPDSAPPPAKKRGRPRKTLHPSPASVKPPTTATDHPSNTENCDPVQNEAVLSNVPIGLKSTPPPAKKRDRPRKTPQPTPALVNPPSTLPSLLSVVPLKLPEVSTLLSRYQTSAAAALPMPVNIGEKIIDISNESTQLPTTDDVVYLKTVKSAHFLSPPNQLPRVNQPAFSNVPPTSPPFRALPINRVPSEIQRSTVDLAVGGRKRTHSDLNLSLSPTPEPPNVAIVAPPSVETDEHVNAISPILRVEPDSSLIPPTTAEVTISIAPPQSPLVNDAANTPATGPEDYFDDLGFEPPSKRWKPSSPPPPLTASTIPEDPTPVGIQITVDSQQIEVCDTVSHQDFPAQPPIQRDGQDRQNAFPITPPDANTNPIQQHECESVATPPSPIHKQPQVITLKPRPPIITPKLGRQSDSTPPSSNKTISDELASQRWVAVVEAYKKRKSAGQSLPFDVSYPSIMPWQRIRPHQTSRRSKPLFNENPTPSTPLTSHPQARARFASLLLRPASKTPPTTSPSTFKKIPPPQVAVKTPIQRHPHVIETNNRASKRFNWRFTLIIFLFLFLFLVVFPLICL